MSNANGFYGDSPHLAHHALSPFDVTRPAINASGGPDFSAPFTDGGVTSHHDGFREGLAKAWRSWKYYRGGKQE